MQCPPISMDGWIDTHTHTRTHTHKQTPSPDSTHTPSAPRGGGCGWSRGCGGRGGAYSPPAPVRCFCGPGRRTASTWPYHPIDHINQPTQPPQQNPHTYIAALGLVLVVRHAHAAEHADAVPAVQEEDGAVCMCTHACVFEIVTLSAIRYTYQLPIPPFESIYSLPAVDELHAGGDEARHAVPAVVGALHLAF